MTDDLAEKVINKEHLSPEELAQVLLTLAFKLHELKERVDKLERDVENV